MGQEAPHKASIIPFADVMWPSFLPRLLEPLKLVYKYVDICLFIPLMVQPGPSDNHTLTLLSICTLLLCVVTCFNELPDVFTVNPWSRYTIEVSGFSCVTHICFIPKGDT